MKRNIYNNVIFIIGMILSVSSYAGSMDLPNHDLALYRNARQINTEIANIHKRLDELSALLSKLNDRIEQNAASKANAKEEVITLDSAILSKEGNVEIKSSDGSLAIKGTIITPQEGTVLLEAKNGIHLEKNCKDGDSKSNCQNTVIKGRVVKIIADNVKCDDCEIIGEEIDLMSNKNGHAL
jgi:hypothetical protein